MRSNFTRRDWLRATGSGGLLAPLCFTGVAPGAVPVPEAAEIEQLLWSKILSAWYPRCLDQRAGGFEENFTEDWTRQPTDSKFIVYQARMTWVPAAVALQYPKRREPYLEYVRHGLEFLTERMWDQQHGGFIELLARSDRADERWQPWKQMYGQAFGIFAAAGAYQATGDRKALELAIDGFRWIERCAHDSQHGGYFELLTANGRPWPWSTPARTSADDFPSLVGSVRNR